MVQFHAPVGIKNRVRRLRWQRTLGGDDTCSYKVGLNGGIVDIGANGGDRFNFDNEASGYQVLLKLFALASAPVSNRQYCAFIDAGRGVGERITS